MESIQDTILIAKRLPGRPRAIEFGTELAAEIEEDLRQRKPVRRIAKDRGIKPSTLRGFVNELIRMKKASAATEASSATPDERNQA